MATILVEGGTLLTLNPRHDVLDPGYLFTVDDQIAALGPGAAPDQLKKQSDEILDATGMAVIPGMVNAHDHLFQTFVRGLSYDRPLMPWLEEIVYPVSGAMTERDVYLAAMLGLVENLHGGATAVIDNQYLHCARGADDAVCEAASRLGIRLLLARGWSDRNVPAAFCQAPDDIISETMRVHTAWHNHDHGRIRVELGPGAPWACSEETMGRTRILAEKLGMGVHMHVAETRSEMEMDRTRTGKGHVEWLASLGMLGPSTQLVHSVWLSDAEVDLIVEAGSSVVHCPVSNMFLASGVCQVGRLRRRGVPVALATDGACNNGQGLIDLLKIAVNLQKVTALDASLFTAEDMLEMACWCGATAFGQRDALGSLEPGKKADVVLVDLNTSRLALARCVPAALVYTANSSDVHTVIVDGKILLRDRRVTGLDEAALVAEAKEAWEGVLRRAGVAG